MQKYREVFPKKHTFLTVIHVENLSQAARNVTVAQNYGADGVFLINHSIAASELISIYSELRLQFQSLWIGMNMLGLSPIDALSRMPDTKCGLWTDNAGVQGNGASHESQAFARFRMDDSNWRGLYFGGVAFKYQEEVDYPAQAAKAATPYVDVITTSGVGTGSAPDVEKIKQMKLAIDDHPLAIASGITPENVHRYLRYADCFLVATGISDSHTELNPERVSELASVIREYD